MEYDRLPDKEERVATAIVDAAFAVHTRLGSGLLESIYEACFCHELARRGMGFRKQVVLPIRYDNLEFAEGFRLDVLVDELVVVEIKAVERMHPVYTAQVLTYLKLTGKRLGFVINFNVSLIKDGTKRVIYRPM